MLQLQLKNLMVLRRSKKASFFFIVLIVSFIVHGLCVLFSFMAIAERAITINTTIQDAPILVVPFLKEVQHTPGNTVAEAKKTLQPCKKEPVKPQTHNKKVEHKKTQPIKNTAVKKDVPKTQLPEKKSIQKQIPKPKVQTPVKKNKPPEKKASVQQKKVVEKKPEKPLIQKEQAPKPVSKTVEPTDSKKEETLKQETTLVGMQERELFVMQDCLKRDILEKWKRPTNIPENALCQFRVKINKHGSKEVILEKPSQALALDMSARNFLLHYDFPEQWVDKEISIIF